MGDLDRTKPRKLWRVVLVLSLALNLAVVGLLAGFSLRSEVGGKPPQGFEVGLGPLGQALSREQRRAIGEELRNQPELRRQGRREAMRVMNRIVDILSAETVDQAALEAVLNSGSDRIADVQRAAVAALVAQVMEMSAQERLQFADRVAEISKRRRPN